MAKRKPDFTGYATRNNLKCADGRTILKDAFKEQDGATVPLVWQHLHDDPSNILGHAILENRDDGVYCYGYFNETPAGTNAKALVEHGDISALSIFANQLVEKAKQVMHGSIKEISLVLAGANPGAWIDNLSFAHSDGTETTVEDEVIYSSGFALDELEHADPTPAPVKKEEPAPTKAEDRTVKDVLDTMNEEQKNVMYALIAQALDENQSPHSAEHSDSDSVFAMFNQLDDSDKKAIFEELSNLFGTDNTIKHDEGDIVMKKNVFDQTEEPETKNHLTREQLKTIVSDAQKLGSMKSSFLAHAEEYGVNPVDVLFPDAKATNPNGPEIIKREDAWVTDFLSGATHTPFSRIKTTVANITADEARAKGYVTGNLKKDEVIPLLRRVTTPTTVYKRQKMDRDDVLDITDFDVVVWLKAEMRGMLNEEIARAALLSDGRSISDEDKVNEQNIRPIIKDDANVYIHRGSVVSTATADETIDAFIRLRKYYKGSGNPVLYTSTDLLTEMLLIKDTLGRRIYKDITELASVLRVSRIVEVEPMNAATRVVSEDQTNTILGVEINPKDYTFGSDKGGDISMFDDFDIDYNQYKYLIETRLSGALTKPKSALVLEKLPTGVSA